MDVLATPTSTARTVPANMAALTSLRALLAWWVVLFHLAPLLRWHPGGSASLLQKGPVMVDCFFLLSGFVLFHAHPQILQGPNKRRRVLGFLLARFARLYPTHLAVLAAFVALLGGLHLATGFRPAHAAAFSTAAFGCQLLLLHGFAVQLEPAWNFPSWSISSELVAYGLAPLLFGCIGGAVRSAYGRRLLLLAAVTMAVLVAGFLESGRIFRFGWSVPRVVLEFSLGAMLRLLAGAAFETLVRIRTGALAVGWCAAALLACSSHPGLFFAAMAWLILLLSLTPGLGGLTGRIGRYLGETSYAVYMCHAFVLLLWAGLQSRLHPGHPLAFGLLICVAIQAGASLLHHLVEVPGRQAIRNRSARWLDRLAPTRTPIRGFAGGVPSSLR